MSAFYESGPKLGAMRERVRLQKAVVSLSDGGRTTVLWQDIASVWAAVRFSAAAPATYAAGQERGQRASLTIHSAKPFRDAARVIIRGGAYTVDSQTDGPPGSRLLMLDVSEVAPPASA